MGRAAAREEASKAREGQPMPVPVPVSVSLPQADKLGGFVDIGVPEPRNADVSLPHATPHDWSEGKSGDTPASPESASPMRRS